MFKVIWLVRFRRDVPRDEVVRWWREEHGPIAARTPGMIRYVQSLWAAPLDPETHLPDTAGEPVFDGHAEHWFESRDAYERAMTSDEWQRTQDDGSTGFDATTLVGAELDEHVVTWQARS